jgi:ribosome biogenesis GTPase A
MIDIDFSIYPLTGWFPGHMLKAEKAMQDALKLVDMVVELIDARAPSSSQNPSFREKLQNKPFITVANKSDLADPAASQRWVDAYAKQGERLFLLDARRTAAIRGLPKLWRQIILDERARRGATRPLTRPVRIMIVGIPNIGKSTLVNHLHERNKAKVGPKPGVTRQNQWIPLPDNVELLDTPGILWPKIETKRHELLLALLGNLKEELVDPVLLADYLACRLSELPKVKWSVLGLDAPPESPDQVLQTLAKRRGLLKQGGVLDLERAANAFIKDYRDGKLGRFTFENPPE